MKTRIAILVLLFLFAGVGALFTARPEGRRTIRPAAAPRPEEANPMPCRETRASIPEEASATTELLDRRDAYARHYLNSDGSVDAEISASPIHYRAPDGSWQEISTEIATSAAGFANERNMLRSYFPRTSDGATRIGTDRFYRWTPVSVGYSMEMAYVPLWQVLSVEGRAQGSQVEYPGIFPGATDRYEVRPASVKHDLVLDGCPPLPAAAIEEMTFDYVGCVELGEGLVFASEDDLRVCTEDGAEQFRLQQPRAVDASGIAGVAGRYVVRPLGGCRYEMHLQFPAAWLADPARVYPVLLDPTTWLPKAPVAVGCIADRTWGGTDYVGFADNAGKPLQAGTAPASFQGDSWFQGRVGRDYDWFNESYRSYVYWNTSSVPYFARILKIETRLYVAGTNYSEFDTDNLLVVGRSLEEQPPFVSNQWIPYDDIGDGTIYFSTRLHTGQGRSSWLPLPDSAWSDFGYSVSGDYDWFGIGFSWGEGGDRGVTLRLDKSRLRVRYNTAPGLFDLASPSNGAKTHGNSVKFKWTPAGDADTDSLTYRLYCENSSSPNLLLYAGPATSFTWNGPIDGTKYSWRVVATDGTASRSSAIRWFRENTPPAVPAPLLPVFANGTATLHWTPSADPDGEPVFYSWRVDTSNPQTFPYVGQGDVLSPGSAPLFVTQPGTTYFWSVRAYDGYEWSAWGGPWSFTAP